MLIAQGREVWIVPVMTPLSLNLHMKLTAPSRRGTGARMKPPAATARPGYVNTNRQEVIRDTGAPSTTRDAQSIYELRCNACRHRYGCNGMDIKARKCPACHGGAVGEPLREAMPSLFDSL
jgi:hypothetical protein